MYKYIITVIVSLLLLTSNIYSYAVTESKGQLCEDVLYYIKKNGIELTKQRGRDMNLSEIQIQAILDKCLRK